tara:strand:- start:323 stop:1162 length:840 start_codon:yes stop_codon:yes gene_type:complete
MIIWLASYPKSGNTWVRLFLKHYFKEPEEKFKINSLSANEFKNITFPDPNLLREMGINYSKFEEIVMNWEVIQDFMNLNKNTNFVKTHSSMCTIGKYRFTTKKNTKGAIYIVRDPRDVLVSNSYYFGLDYEKTFRQLSSSNVFEYQALTKSYKRFKKSLMGSWADNYNSWKNYKFSPLLIIRYEDMVLNGHDTFLKIVKFLNKIDGLKIDETKLKNSLEQTQFRNLQKIEIQHGFEDKAKKGFFFRKGIIGSWKDEVPNEIIKRIEKVFYQEMLELKYL